MTASADQFLENAVTRLSALERRLEATYAAIDSARERLVGDTEPVKKGRLTVSPEIPPAEIR
ncbi:hypothetical protein [Sphingomonas sp. SRS2]|uniref:hypothetical protein n=1 Tax=Sphingomonas sp. SRS2 TaxID=133190 RepID=UPI0006184397|nr:hypothetical protein [Sphingomonas sp. SRS2]KKC24803.1 hypothetical protein WP12_17590 [Sphingomonas sp. SRS2]